jgi:DNA-nicking Smr family endonuclease
MKELDLHGVKHENVGSLLDTFIWENMQQKAHGIKIITGNSPEMKKIVSDIVVEYGFIAVEGFGNTASMIVNFI